MFYLGRYDSIDSRAEDNRIIAEWLTQGGGSPLSRARAPSSSEPADRTTCELARDYWAFVQGYRRKDREPTSQVEQIQSAIGPLRRLYGDTRPGTSVRWR